VLDARIDRGGRWCCRSRLFHCGFFSETVALRCDIAEEGYPSTSIHLSIVNGLQFAIVKATKPLNGLLDAEVTRVETHSSLSFRAPRIQRRLLQESRKGKPMGPKDRDLEDTKLPLKTVVVVSIAIVGWVLSLAGVYYNLRADVRSLQERPIGSDSAPELIEMRLRVERLEEELTRVDSEMDEPPTSLDHLQRIGGLTGDVRELKVRVEALERER